MATKNHYGIWVDSEKAVPGVLIANKVPGLIEEIANGIGLGEDEERGAVLVGAWRKAADGRYEPHPDGDYSAIVSEVYAQVVQSKYTQRVALCSRCFPGQGNLDTEGEFLAFTLPPTLFEAE